MYSLVLMAAMNGGAAEAPQFHRHRDYTPYVVVTGCCGGSCCGGGCCGGTPVVVSGCCGGGCCGGTPVVVSGCCGGGCCGGMPVVVSGCCGGGCCGGGYATNWGTSSFPQTNWSEGCACTHPITVPSYGCSGCFGSTPGLITVPGQPMMPPPAVAPVPNTDPKEMPKKPLTQEMPAGSLLRSEVTLLLPTGSKLFVNSAPNETVSPNGQFETPPLPAGGEFTYVFTAVAESDGTRREVSRRVTFKAGETLRVDLRDPSLARNDSAGR